MLMIQELHVSISWSRYGILNALYVEDAVWYSKGVLHFVGETSRSLTIFHPDTTRAPQPPGRQVTLGQPQRQEVGSVGALWRVAFNLTGTTLAVSPDVGQAPAWWAPSDGGDFARMRRGIMFRWTPHY